MAEVNEGMTGGEPGFAQVAALEGDRDVSAASNQLEKNAMRLWGLLFAVISCVAPMAAAVFNTAVMAGYAGATAPLDFLIGAVGLLFLIAPISYFASRLSSTAGFYTWVAHGLGQDLGFLTGWLVFGAYAIFEAASQAAFGGLMDFNLSTFFNVNIPNGYGWVVYAVASVLLVGVLGYFGVRASVWILAQFSSLVFLRLL